MRWSIASLQTLVTLCALGISAPAAAHPELTVVTWGGAYTKSQVLGYIRDFERESGVDVEVLEYAGGIDVIRDQTREHNIHWDVVDLEIADAIRACDAGLLERIDPDTLPAASDGTPAREDFLPGTLRECAVGTVIWATTVAYDTQRVRRAPQRLEDFFNPDDFPGRRGLRRTPKGNLEFALMADGVAPERVYTVLSTEAGVSRALDMLDRIKADVRWWRAGEDAVRLLESGEVTMTTAYNGRIAEAVEARDAPFAIVWDGHVRNLDLWGVPVHGEQTELAMDFVRFAARPSSLAKQARYIPYGPVRESALELIGTDRRAVLPTAPANSARQLQIDANWWARNIDRLGPRFERWIDKPTRVPERLPR